MKRTSSHGRADVVIAGAGPAGVLTAVLLARFGHEVLLLTGGRRQPRIEGLSQRVVDILRSQGLGTAASAVGPFVGREVLWDGERGARNREYVTERVAFDAALQRDAAAAGVALRDVRRLKVRTREDGADLAWTAPEGREAQAEARFFIEARGRAAPGGRTRQQRGPETTALTRRIAGAGEGACTALESFHDGWAWYVSDGGSAFLQIFLDSDGLPKRPGLAARFDRAAAELTLIGEVLGSGRAEGAVLTRGATPAVARDLIKGAVLRVGDAALAVDPLSGHGNFEALGSALAAAAVVNTLLTKSENAALAQRFYEERARTAFLRYCRVGRDFYALERRWSERDFWRRRAAWPDDEPAHPTEDLDRATVLRRPVVEEGIVVERRVLVTSDQPRGIWRLDGVPLPQLLDRLGEAEGQALAACAPAMAADLEVEEAQLASALAWLQSRRLLAAGEEIRLQRDRIETEAPEPA